MESEERKEHTHKKKNRRNIVVRLPSKSIFFSLPIFFSFPFQTFFFLPRVLIGFDSCCGQTPVRLVLFLVQLLHTSFLLSSFPGLPLPNLLYSSYTAATIDSRLVPYLIPDQTFSSFPFFSFFVRFLLRLFHYFLLHFLRSVLYFILFLRERE